MGSIYKRGEVFWIKYYRNGKPYRESSKTDDMASQGGTSISYAKKLLKHREGEVVDGRFPGLNIGRILFDELAGDFLSDYQINERKSLDHAERYVRNLKEFFGGMKAVNITSSLIDEYIKKKQGQGLVNATINRDLSALKRIFSIGVKKGKVINPPHVPHLEENNVRRGFFEHDEYLKLKTALPEHLRLPLTLAYTFGFRKEEVFSLVWPQFNLIDGKITLTETKNGESRIALLRGEVYEEVFNQKLIRDKLYSNCPYVCHREGQRIKDFRSAWGTALKKIGKKPTFKCKNCGKVTELPDGVKKEDLKCYACGIDKLKKHDKIFHDLRRTAVRNMVRAGISEKVAMLISGHSTRSVFDRYDIVDERDLENAAESITAFHRQASEKIERINLQVGIVTRQKSEMGTVPGTKSNLDREGEGRDNG